MRLERKSLVTLANPFDLFADIPVEAEAVADLMSRRKAFA